jgi:hypothetical protein
MIAAALPRVTSLSSRHERGLHPAINDTVWFMAAQAINDTVWFMAEGVD